MKPPSPKTPSEAFLIAMNLLPLAGALFWGWKIFDILLLYWVENVIIGVLNVFKFCAFFQRKKLWIAFPIVPFFIFHYGMFCLGHGVFVLLIFGLQLTVGEEGPPFEDGLQVALDVLQDPMFMLAAAGLVASHTFSFIVNFIGKGEVDRLTLPALMNAPYGRVVALHITILLGGGLALALGEPIWAPALLTLIKTAGDLRAHRKSHAKIAAPQ